MHAKVLYTYLDVGALHGAQSALGRLALSADLGDGLGVVGQVCAMLFLEGGYAVVHHALIEVLSSQVRVARSGLDLEHAVVNGQQGHIKSAAPQVEYQDILLRLCRSTV